MLTLRAAAGYRVTQTVDGTHTCTRAHARERVHHGVLSEKGQDLVLVHLCLYAYAYIFVHMYTFVCECVCVVCTKIVCMYPCTYLYTRAHTHQVSEEGEDFVRKLICLSVQDRYTATQVWPCYFRNPSCPVTVCACVCVSVCLRVCVSVCLCVCVCTVP